jgi:hypothetical protein
LAPACCQALIAGAERGPFVRRHALCKSWSLRPPPHSIGYFVVGRAQAMVEKRLVFFGDDADFTVALDCGFADLAKRL